MIVLIFNIVDGVVALQWGAGKEWAWETSDVSTPPLQYKMFYNDSAKEQVCKRFWELLDTSRCINLNVGKDEGTWCYVNSACKTLNGGSEISDQFSWKKCSAHELKFSDYTPEELFMFSHQHDIWFGGLEKISHPGSKIGESQLVGVNDLNDEIPTWVALKLKEFGIKNMPYWFDTNENGTMPFMIVHDNKVYKVESGPAQDP